VAAPGGSDGTICARLGALGKGWGFTPPPIARATLACRWNTFGAFWGVAVYFGAGPWPASSHRELVEWAFIWTTVSKVRGLAFYTGVALSRALTVEMGGLGYADGWAGYPDHELGAGGAFPTVRGCVLMASVPSKHFTTAC